MKESELLEKVKVGMLISGTYNDAALLQKMRAAKSFMIGGGVSELDIESESGIGCLTIGTNDLFNLSSGEVKFSPVFNMILTQLSAGENNV